MKLRSTTLAVTAALALAACGSDVDTAGPAPDASSAPTTIDPATGDDAVDDAEQRFPDIVDATATYDTAAGTWSFAVTVSSPYDTPDRYADGWRVVGPDGAVYGVHTLGHDHANEQPFTRRQTGVVIPEGVEEVTIEGRDQAYGFGGGTLTIALQTG